MSRSIFTRAPLALAFIGAGGVALGGDGVTPSSIDLDLDPGEVEVVNLEVCIPGEAGVELADVYFMADVTGSMGSILASVVADASTIANDLLSRPGTDLQIGVGRYRDFPPSPSNDFAFENQLAVTSNQPSIVGAIGSWSTFGGAGGDTPEGQLFALHQIANDPAIGWRPGAKRIICWFGDAPGHDPICSAISGEAFDVTEGSVTADLVASGPGGTAVIAISTITGAGSLNGDPTSGASDYIPFCVIGGASGQATRIAGATGGVDLEGVAPGTIVDAILDTIDQVLSEVTVSLQPKGDTAGFITNISPDSIDVVIPDDPAEEVCVRFDVTFEGQDCTENVYSFDGSINVLFDGAPSGESVPVTIDQSRCDSTCLLFVGTEEAFAQIGQGLAGPEDFLYTLPLLTFPVLMDDSPVIDIPDSPGLQGFVVYTQVGMLNSWDFPDDPIQMSNGLAFTIGGHVSSYGDASGITQWPMSSPELGGTIEIDFVIDGL